MIALGHSLIALLLRVFHFLGGNEVTLVLEFKSEYDSPVAVIHSLYPGHDVGDLEGDMTVREDRVWFNWNHPGA